MDDITDREQYVKDPRMACKYGPKCYQKNPEHSQKYKHPPPKGPNTKKRTNNDTEQLAKKFKVDLAPIETDPKEESIETDPKSDDESNINASPKEAIDSQTPTVKVRTPKTIPDLHEFIKSYFLVTMPEDFYEFWKLCEKLKKSCPQEAFKDVGLHLVGPYDVLAGKFCDVELSEDDFLVHWRFFYDPPECQTVLKGDDKKGFHVGYFRDSPKDLPVCLVHNSSKIDGVFTVCGDNIFAAVYIYLENMKKFGDPFKKMHIGKFQNILKQSMEELKLDCGQKTEKIKSREKKIVARSFSKLGIVVPYNRKTQLGYRQLSISNTDLQKMLNDIRKALPEQKPKYLSKLQDILTNTSIATDECDFGTGIELGLDILAHGIDSLNVTIARVLATNYRLLDREGFAKIIEAHMKKRDNGTNLSII
ncbi:unnamed protein product [Ceutorhynchus assimilis]|uniref:PBZ-type domain-containing protein n=1 Tax=Ceutorhynchus assimilis TaxID=467358 RepID=A0A9N9QMM4_9CUCU|nr:unnamed protein product [Ceutorhynchus assimilis]